MNPFEIDAKKIRQFIRFLRERGASAGTMEKYQRDLRRFADWLDGTPASREAAVRWRESLLAEGCRPATVNSMLAAVNAFFRCMGWNIHAEFLRVQKKTFCDPRRELTRPDYFQLLETAGRLRKERLFLLLETVCATGIRVGEVRYITVEAAKAGKAEISLKGKTRTILLPGKLCRKLLGYARKHKTASGEIFLTRSGKSISRKQIWAEMKALCRKAGVEPGKVFPHNLRHLFARTFYQTCRDVVKLSDVLGHSSIETTRIYLISSGTEHMRLLERMRMTL